ncbi:hypothetical protein EJ03DRAFT_81314 [Teratosphaeria nubilosa]|uniref:Uncharacterized protein n=1 Tax=Teratosphaeria nubilosa TaxID=161662 RepID=A0A6G1LCL3_9PEZI|nr:hypothetical protein EJ03DRAFT_81314 [Teratosphaeria nubilosa]
MLGTSITGRTEMLRVTHQDCLAGWHEKDAEKARPAEFKASETSAISRTERSGPCGVCKYAVIARLCVCLDDADPRDPGTWLCVPQHRDVFGQEDRGEGSRAPVCRLDCGFVLVTCLTLAVGITYPRGPKALRRTQSCAQRYTMMRGPGCSIPRSLGPTDSASDDLGIAVSALPSHLPATGTIITPHLHSHA